MASLVAALLGCIGLPAAAQTPVDLELVLAVDVSPSMDRDEHELQRAGYVAAVAHPEVVSAIRSGPIGRIALTYVEWSAAGSQTVVVPWRVIEDEASAGAFALELAGRPTSRMRGTSISGALLFTAGLFEASGYESFRQVVDVSGDGANNMGLPVVPSRDVLLERGVVINGLPIVIRRSAFPSWGDVDLAVYYEDCVIGGPGSFVLAVTEPERLAESIRRKLVLEIAGLPARVVPANATAPRIDCMIGERLRRMWNDR
jgi:hypothetical protein